VECECEVLFPVPGAPPREVAKWLKQVRVRVRPQALVRTTSASAVYMQHNNNRRRILAGSKGTGKAQRLVVDWRGNGPPGAL
jgi:hypothetical protein